jgi:hypothetical protein
MGVGLNGGIHLNGRSSHIGVGASEPELLTREPPCRSDEPVRRVPGRSVSGSSPPSPRRRRPGGSATSAAASSRLPGKYVNDEGRIHPPDAGLHVVGPGQCWRSSDRVVTCGHRLTTRRKVLGHASGAQQCTGNRGATLDLASDLVGAVGVEVLAVDPKDSDLQLFVRHRPLRWRGIPRCPASVRAGSAA